MSRSTSRDSSGKVRWGWSFPGDKEFGVFISPLSETEGVGGTKPETREVYTSRRLSFSWSLRSSGAKIRSSLVNVSRPLPTLHPSSWFPFLPTRKLRPCRLFNPIKGFQDSRLLPVPKLQNIVSKSMDVN